MQRLAKRCALRAHGVGRVGLTLRAGEGWGDGEGGALAKKLVVGGWWLLVNEGSVACL